MDDSIPSDDWLFADRYRVDAPIGTGGMGKVWSGYDKRLDRRVAIKLMHQPPAAVGGAEGAALAEAAATDRERFLREIRTMARLELPGVPAVYDFGTEDDTGRIYLVMQLVSGPTLADLLRADDEERPVGWAAAIAAQIAATLADVHAVDVVHRDIKPANIIVSPGGLVKVLDFGVAILQGARALPKLTQTGMTVGSPPYMPPEQVLGNPVGPASDVYALGCVLYQLLTGTTPFAETSAHSYLDKHVTAPAPAPSASRPGLPDGLSELVLAMLAKRPEARPEAASVYETLSGLAASVPVDAQTEAAVGAAPAVADTAGTFRTAERPGAADGVAGPADDHDPRRPFLRPLAPAPRRRGTTPAARAARPAPPPLGIDEALEVHERVMALVDDGELRAAIDLLDDAVARSAGLPPVRRELRIVLASTLYAADEYTRAATAYDAILPELAGDEKVASLYHAGVSHAEAGHAEPAIEYLTAFLDAADRHDVLYPDALYQLGVMLAAAGNLREALRHLDALRPLLVARYGTGSVHVTSLDRRITRLRDRLAP